MFQIEMILMSPLSFLSPPCQEWSSWRSSCAGFPSTWAGRFSFLPTMLRFYTLCPSTSTWCPLSSSTSAPRSIPCCTTWCRPDIDTLCTASYAHSRTHSLIACARLRHTSPRPLCRGRRGTPEWTHTLQAGNKRTSKHKCGHCLNLNWLW